MWVTEGKLIVVFEALKQIGVLVEDAVGAVVDPLAVGVVSIVVVAGSVVTVDGWRPCQQLTECRVCSSPNERRRSESPCSRRPSTGGASQYDLPVTTLPMWAVYLVSFGAPIAAFVGVVVGHILLRKGANELDVWRRREETMRMLRWASEQAASNEGAKSRMGVAALGALSTSELLQAPDQDLVDAVIDSLIEEPIEEIEEAAGEVEVIEIDNSRDN